MTPAKMAAPPIPPTTPPTIGPTLLECCSADAESLPLEPVSELEEGVGVLPARDEEELVEEKVIEGVEGTGGDDSAGLETERARATVALKRSGVTTSRNAHEGILVPGGTFSGQLSEEKHQICAIQ